MTRLVPIPALLILAAGPALAQDFGSPVPTGALPAVTDRGATPSGPPITIDPRGLNGGVTGDVLTGTSAVVIDSVDGGVQPLGAPSSVVVLSPGGTDAAAVGAASTTLNPSPPTAPLCRERRQPGCRGR